MTYKLTFWRTLAAVAAMLLTMPATVWAQSAFGGGSGTQIDPYQIYNPGHFVQLADEVNAGNSFEGVYFKLTSSVDFRLYGPIPPIGGRYYTDDGGTGIRRFCGYFLGNNRTLYNLTISENPDQCGLFGCLGYGGLVMDLTIDGNSTITGIGDTGAIVGSAELNTNIINCTVGENVVVKVHPDAAGRSYFPGEFGGIVGSTSGSVSNCVSKASVSNSGINKASQLGGIAGSVNNAGRLEYCYFLGTVDGTNTVGDIAGTNDGTIVNCYYHTANRHGGINGADADGAKWMGTVAMASGVRGSLPSATYTDGGTPYFGADKYMLLTLNYSVPDGYVQTDDQVDYKANDIAIGATESGGKPYYEFTMPGEDVTITAVAHLKRDIAYAPWVSIDIPEQTYTGEALTPVVTVTDLNADPQAILIEGTDYTITLPDADIVDAGQYPITVTGIGDFAGTATVMFSVVPANVAGIVTHPTAIEGLTYNGRAQVLITAGEATNGVMHYRLEGGEYSAELPTAISAGTYTVYYKAHGDVNHYDSSEQSLVAQIAQVESTWEGEGTAEAPYLIKSVVDMNLIALKQEELDYTGVYFRLENDLDYTNAEQLPIGSLQRRFNGNFDGNGHTLTNLVIDKPGDNNVAIFGVTDENAVISNLHLGEGCAFTGYTSVGSFAGLFEGTITNCSTGPGVTVSGNKEVAGIAGSCVGRIDHCVNQATVKADTRAGGITGAAYNTLNVTSVLTDNLNLGSVEANSFVGGIAGYNFNATYTNNYYVADHAIGAIGASGMSYGADRPGQAQRGFAISGGEEVTVELVDDATVGVSLADAVYAGTEQQVVLRLSEKHAASQQSPAIRAPKFVTSFKASSGELTDNGDGTWTLTMPAEGDNVTISTIQIPTSVTDVNADAPSGSRRYNLMGQPVGSDYKGIVIEAGRKRVIN